jgi:hypothetical protein
MTGPDEWDLRVADGGAQRAALTHGLCWVCGFPFTRQEDRAFVIGPMCAVNRTSAEPPSHVECATYSAQACPFLSTPRMTRRERHLPEGTSEPGGIMLRRNPGVTLVWVTSYRGWGKRRDPAGGYVFDIGDPRSATWWCEGRPATRAEVEASIDSGLPSLQGMAEDEGPESVAKLERMLAVAREVLPAA